MNKNLSLWMVGPEIKNLQRMLNYGHDQPFPLKLDGIFGPKTATSVMQYQKLHTLQQDGIVGPITGKALVGSVLHRVFIGQRA